MSYKYVLDTSVWVEYFLGSAKGTKVSHIIEEERIAISVIAIAELADKFERDKQDFSQQLQFIQNRAAIVPLTIPLSLHAAHLKNEMRSTHAKFSLADGIHLATAHQ